MSSKDKVNPLLGVRRHRWSQRRLEAGMEGGERTREGREVDLTGSNENEVWELYGRRSVCKVGPETGSGVSSRIDYGERSENSTVKDSK